MQPSTYDFISNKFHDFCRKIPTIREAYYLLSRFCQEIVVSLTKLYSLSYHDKGTWKIPFSDGVVVRKVIYVPNIFQQGFVYYDMESGWSSVFLEKSIPNMMGETFSEILFYDSDNNTHCLKNIQIKNDRHLQGIIPNGEQFENKIFIYGKKQTSISNETPPLYIVV